MSRKMSSNQIRTMIIWSGILVIVVLICSILLLSKFKVNTKSSGKSIINQLTNKANKSENIVVTDDVVTPDNLEGASYKFTCLDDIGSMEVILENGIAKFKVVDEEKFEEKYPDSVIDTDTELPIATHDYHLKNVYIEKCNGKEYFLTVTKDGKIGIMDIEEAVNTNVFRIKNELISIQEGDAVNIIYSSTRSSTNEGTADTAIVESVLGQKYDLEKLIE